MARLVGLWCCCLVLWFNIDYCIAKEAPGKRLDFWYTRSEEKPKTEKSLKDSPKKRKRNAKRDKKLCKKFRALFKDYPGVCSKASKKKHMKKPKKSAFEKMKRRVARYVEKVIDKNKDVLEDFSQIEEDEDDFDDFDHGDGLRAILEAAEAVDDDESRDAYRSLKEAGVLNRHSEIKNKYKKTIYDLLAAEKRHGVVPRNDHKHEGYIELHMAQRIISYWERLVSLLPKRSQITISPLATYTKVVAAMDFKWQFYDVLIYSCKPITVRAVHHAIHDRDQADRLKWWDEVVKTYLRAKIRPKSRPMPLSGAEPMLAPVHDRDEAIDSLKYIHIVYTKYGDAKYTAYSFKRPLPTVDDKDCKKHLRDALDWRFNYYNVHPMNDLLGQYQHLMHTLPANMQHGGADAFPMTDIFRIRTNFHSVNSSPMQMGQVFEDGRYVDRSREMVCLFTQKNEPNASQKLQVDSFATVIGELQRNMLTDKYKDLKLVYAGDKDDHTKYRELDGGDELFIDCEGKYYKDCNSKH